MKDNAIIYREKWNNIRMMNRTMTDSAVYDTFKWLADRGERIPTQKEWGELSRLVNSCHPAFEERLRRHCRLNSRQYHACLLRKAGFGITETAFLTCYAKSSVTTLYVRLYQKLTGEKGTVRVFDRLLDTL